MSDRTVIAVTGTDRESFLQGLITNDVARARGGLIYAALLTPQGKYLADFFVAGEAERLLIDVDSALAAPLAQRLSMYKLRADVGLEETGLTVSRGTGEAPPGAVPDPRHPDLGWRLYGPEDVSDGTDFEALRLALGIPETGSELTPDSYILEMDFERLKGVDFRKGCYVGQEVTARMKHKTTLRKGLARVAVEGAAEPGTPITREGREVGRLLSNRDGTGLAYLRFDRAGDGMAAGEVAVRML